MADSETSECIIGVAVETDVEVDEMIGRAARAGAVIVTAPGSQPWGYTGTFADPDGHLWMVTSTPV